jgi:hypothetical protein
MVTCTNNIAATTAKNHKYVYLNFAGDIVTSKESISDVVVSH